VFKFDLGAYLFTCPYEDEPEERLMDQWHLYEPSGMVLSFRGDGKYSRQTADTPASDEEYFDLI
jgi:hypothetical protein